MRSHRRALTPLALLLIGMTLPSYAQTAPAAAQSANAPVTKTVTLKYLFPTQFIRMLKGETVANDLLSPQNKPVPDPLEGMELTPNDSARSITVRASAEKAKELEALVRFLDVKPRSVKVEMKVYELQPAADGTIKEVLVASPTLSSQNNTAAGNLSFVHSADGMLQVQEYSMTPHINEDNSMTLEVTFGSMPTRNEMGPTTVFPTKSKLIRRIEQKEWVSLGKVSSAKDKAIRDAISSGAEPTPAAYPLFRIEARATEITQ